MTAGFNIIYTKQNFLYHKRMKKVYFYRICLFLTVTVLTYASFSQETLKSTEEEYYDFLSIQGITTRPSLNYRTLSDSEWNFTEKEETAGETELSHPWQNNNLGPKRALWQPQEKSESFYLKGVPQGIFVKLYGPEWYNSYNTAAPYGQNDGALWQGKGYNTSLTAGVRLEAYGLELTVKPQLCWQENREFEYINPNYPENDKDGNPTVYSGKASEYGYYGVSSIDAPQRLGDKSFWTFDWGDTEIRYTWHTLTVGFGTQSIWLGPAKLNPIIHSNNAASYLKFDIGLRNTAVYFPYFKWYLGDIEARAWWGKLSESDYFDNNDDNDNNLISGLSIAWKLPFTDLTFGLNRTMLSKWNNIDKYSLFHIYLPFDSSGGDDDSDQRFSFTADWIFTSLGLEIYFEWGRNDFSSTFSRILMYPFHTQGWSAGIRKTIAFTPLIKGELLLECTNLESSRDYELLWPTTFYAHHIVTQGYTNKGQWLAASMTGGNSQYIGFNLYYPKGSFYLFLQRANPDLDYTWYLTKDQTNSEREHGMRVILSSGLGTVYCLKKSLLLDTSAVISYDNHPLFTNEENLTERVNVNIAVSMKYNF